MYFEAFKNLCRRPNMYVGNNEIFDIENDFDKVIIFINGIFHGMQKPSLDIWPIWVSWIKNNFESNEHQKWDEILLNKYVTKEKVLQELSGLFQRFCHEQDIYT